jgi:predicted TIM-barrel fold metal-dependent hydrolase
MSTPASPPAGAPLVDCHAHVWSADMPFAANAWKRPDYSYTVEDFLADLDAQGIRYGVIAAASLFGNNNAYSVRAVTAHQRLRATAIVDTGIELEDLAALRAVGIVGVRLQWFFLNPLPNMDGEEFLLLCNRMRQLDMHFHLNINGERLVAVAEHLLNTGVKLVIDHFGWHDPAPRLAAPSYQGMLKLLERENLWVKMTSGYRHPDEHHPDWSLPVAYAQDLLQRFGPTRLLWGSDAPFIGHEHVASYALAIERFEQCVPDAATRRAIGENAHRFYFGNP